MIRNASNAEEDLKKPIFYLEKYKYVIDLLKWFFGSIVIVFITLIIDNGFKDRTAGIQEMQAFDKYVEIILKADNIEERWKLAEFFSTVTPTERLRDKWISYKKLLSADYKTFKTLKEKESKLKEEIKTRPSIAAYDKLNKIKKQLEPFEKKLVDEISTTPSSKSYEGMGSNSQEPEIELKKFKETIKKDAINDTRYKVGDYFKKANEINNDVVYTLVKELGEPYQDIQTAIDYNYKESVYSNKLGIISKFDESKKIWPLFQAKFTPDQIVITLKENESTETFKSNTIDVDWVKIKQFIRSYYLKRLEQLR